MSANLSFSIKQAFVDSTVFLTGASGYIGSIVLEQLLRLCPGVKTIFVLVRDKKTKSAKERLEDLLSTGLFHLLWDSNVFKKIRLVRGDVDLERLGLAEKDFRELISETTHVIHCAADVALNEPIQKTLRSNYGGVSNILSLCEEMTQLKAYTHISTSYVNINHPSGTLIKEEIYPLLVGDRDVPHGEIVNELLSLTKEEAAERVRVMLARWNFPNTYCFGKNLAEKLVADYCKKFPCSIVRPSLVAGILGQPYPGYIDGLASAASLPIAFAVGFYSKHNAAWKASSVTDGIPADIVASTVLLATAYVSQAERQPTPMIFQSGSSTTNPITNGENYNMAKEFFTKEPPPYCLLFGKYPERPFNYEPKKHRLRFERKILAIKVYVVSTLLTLGNKKRVARRLRTGWKAWTYAEQKRYDLNLFFSVKNTENVYSMVIPEEQADFKCLFTPDVGTWARYSRTYLCGVKSLLLKSPVKYMTDHDFVLIPKRETLISLDHEAVVNPPAGGSEPEGSQGPEVSPYSKTDQDVPNIAIPKVPDNEGTSTF